MKSKLFACCFIGLAASACQPEDYINPDDGPPTGASPAQQIFKFDAETSSRFLGANLEQSNALQAEYTIVEQNGAQVLVPVQVAGTFPETAGADADLLGGVGFGTYVNPDRNSTVWSEGSFQSKLAADLILTKPGDAVKFCRSFATTCVTVQMAADGSGLAVLNLAANVPDTEIGEIAPGVSAAIRGTGSEGLTIAVADPTVLARPFEVTAGTPFTLEWTIARGPITGLPPGAGSIQYSLSVNGTELASGNTLTALGGAITKEGGVVMQFELPPGAELKTEVDYSYAYEGDAPEFDYSNAFGTGVAMSPQPGLTFSPLAVYPTVDPGYELLTLTGAAGTPHSVQTEDGVLGAISAAPTGPLVTLFSTAFNGDDFEGTPLAGAVDQATEGGGFYPSPALCYSQIHAQVEAQVSAAVREGTRALMYARIATGVALADAGLEALAGQLAAGGAPVTYTRLGDVAGGDLDAYIAIGTDYANSNLDTNIATPEAETYTVTLNDTVSQTFRDQLVAIVTAAEAADVFEPDNPQYLALKALQVGLTTPPGSKETVEANLATNLKAQIIAAAADRPPVLALACLWGLPAKAEVPAADATLIIEADPQNQNFGNDKPATPAIPAQPAVAPAREQAAAQINQLVLGVFGNFIGQVFGLTVPASNFSLSMEIGDPAGGTAPAVRSILITNQ